MKRTKAPTADGSDLPNDVTETSQTVAVGQLRSFIERVERLVEEKQAIQGDISDVFAEMKGAGFDTKAVRAIIKLRAMDQAQRQEQEAMVDLYKSAMGMA